MVAVDCPQPPTIEPENADVFDAFNRVVGCNHPVMSAGMGPPIWSDIRTVLELHDLWTPHIQERLGKLLSMIREHTNREASEKPRDAVDLTKRDGNG